MINYESVIGLEIHAELKTESKMFCGCKNDPNEKHPNINICPICTGQPGTLPVINEEAVKKVIKVGLALKGKIAGTTKWDRKNYFYPDLPKGYQISQYDSPICLGGELIVPGFDKKIRITRVHLEEDTGRLVHFGHIGHSLVDYNRAGIPLMEMVTEPDFSSGEEASAFAQELQLLLRYLDVSSADMEKGQMRIEANLSLKLAGSETLGTKVEIKNLNSFKAARDAIDYEIKRQTKLLENGEKITQQTRGWSDAKGETVLQRTKEESHDYRYFPEPDLPPFSINGSLIAAMQNKLPELPADKRKRLIFEYNIAKSQADILVGNEKLANFFENAVSELMGLTKGGKRELSILSANYLLSDFLGLLNEASAEIDDTRITAENFAEWIGLIHKGAITTRAAKEILKEMWATGKDPDIIINERDLGQVNNKEELKTAIIDVLSKNPEPVADYKKGKQNSIMFLVGQVMAVTRGKANPETVIQLLKSELDKK